MTDLQKLTGWLKLCFKSGSVEKKPPTWSGFGEHSAWCHFQQYFSYIVAVSYIGDRNQSTWRKPLICRKSLKKCITLNCSEYTLPQARFKITTLVLTGAKGLGNCKSLNVKKRISGNIMVNICSYFFYKIKKSNWKPGEGLHGPVSL